MSVGAARIVALATAALSVLCGRYARAEVGRAVAIIVEGTAGPALAARIGTHVERPNAVRDAQPLRVALAARGSRALAAVEGNKGRNAQLIARVHSAATQTNVDVAILVTVRKSRSAIQMHVWVVGARGEAAWADKELSLESSATLEAQADAVWGLAASIFPARPTQPAPPVAQQAPVTAPAEAAAPPVEPEAPAAPATPVAGDIDIHVAHQAPIADEALTRANAVLVVQAAMGGGSRHFSYVDRITPELRPYDLVVAPVPSIAVEVYPMARTRLPVLTGLGVVADYARAVGLASTDAAGTPVSTSWQNFDVGLRQGIRLGAAALGIVVGYGETDFHFDEASRTSAKLPTVSYQFLRAGLDVRGYLGALSLFGSGAYLYPLSAGALGRLFPHEHLAGIEARVGVARTMGRSFEVSLAVEYTRFFYSFNPVPGDANVAGGALDEMAQLSLGIAYLL